MSNTSLFLFRQSALSSFINIVISIFIVLFGMQTLSLFLSGVIVSYTSIFFIVIALKFLCISLGIEKSIGKVYSNLYILIVCLIIFFSLEFSTRVLFADYLSGKSSSISEHWEHNWCYEQILYYADAISQRQPLLSILTGVTSPQYIVTHAYSSLVFLYGGNTVTHYCVWNGLHLAITSALIYLIARTMGVVNKDQLSFVLIASLIMPAFDILYIYDRDIVGEALLILGVYFFCCSYKKGVKWCILMFPIYGFFFLGLRLQYLAIAFMLMGWSFMVRLKGNSAIIILSVFSILGILLLSTTSLWNLLNIGTYMDSSESKRGIISTLMVGLIGYFPWTNLLKDPHISYHFPMCLQAVVDLVIWILFYRSCRGNYRRCFYNPVFLCAIVLAVFGFVGGVGHVKYFCVSAPLFLIGIKGMKISYLIRCYFIMTVIYVMASVLYDLMGLTGSGIG